MPWEPVSFNPQSRPRPGTPHTLFTDGGTEQRGQGPGPGHTLVGVKGWEQDRRLGSDLPDTCPAMTSPHHCCCLGLGAPWVVFVTEGPGVPQIFFNDMKQGTQDRTGSPRVSCPPGRGGAVLLWPPSPSTEKPRSPYGFAPCFGPYCPLFLENFLDALSTAEARNVPRWPRLALKKSTA